jgi:2,3-bisphosphoglycerate-independent phosphoglycerate mutase
VYSFIGSSTPDKDFSKYSTASGLNSKRSLYNCQRLNVTKIVIYFNFRGDMRVLFMFLDGVGLGGDDLSSNPFAHTRMPNLIQLLGGQRFLAATAPFDGSRASLRAIDANLGVGGLPQSATGQAVLLTGANIPAALGYHYGPKPNPETAAFLQAGGIFGELTRGGKRAALVNAYPAGYFHGIDSGKRIYSSIPLAVTRAGLSLFNADDLQAGRAISADFTARVWRERLGYINTPILALPAAGAHLAALSTNYDFAFFEYWLSDYAGHRQDMEPALRLLEEFDAVLGGLLDTWRDDEGLILLTSDHGNLEDLSTRRHTANPVPLLLIGSQEARSYFEQVIDLAGVAPAILQYLNSAA